MIVEVVKKGSVSSTILLRNTILHKNIYLPCSYLYSHLVKFA